MNYNDTSKYSSNYSERGFWKKVKSSVMKAGDAVIRTALTLYYHLEDTSISSAQKVAIIGALGFFIMPLDIIPDAIPVLGFTDDLAALTAVYNLIKDNVSDSTLSKVETKMNEWFS